LPNIKPDDGSAQCALAKTGVYWAAMEALMLENMHILAREFVRWNPDFVDNFRIPDPRQRARPQDAWGEARRLPARGSIIQAFRRLLLRCAPREA
jgi:hypothetical protein